MITLPNRAYIAIPAALRRRCGLEPGDRVLLAAALEDDSRARSPSSSWLWRHGGASRWPTCLAW
jgi:bifunctional DNA-binding transcriptional regulator/antitoxin component of YhaV-PrlF toxin-antitoxin module